MKINKRLNSLAKMVEDDYLIVWDCCCDHGLLGMSLLATSKAKQVNFVDIVPDILSKLRNKLIIYNDQFPIGASWETFCCDVASMDFNLTKGLAETVPVDAKQLVIISGVGGDLMVEMINKLIPNNINSSIDYLLCPVLHTYKLRDALKILNCKVKSEKLVIDNKRGYEMLLVSQNEGEEITLSGDTIWLNKIEHEQYLLNLIDHYGRIRNGKDKLNDLNESALASYKNAHNKYYS